ncbi:MAG: ABC transporter permease [Sphingobacteriales bacterium]
MKSILLIIKSNFRSKKWMTLLTGLSIALAALLFSSGLSILQSIQQPFDKLFNKLNASHIIMLYDINNESTSEFKDWFAHQPETERVSEGSPYFFCNGPLLHKGKNIEVMIQLTEYHSDNSIQDKLMIIEGVNKKSPGYGEIWLPKYLANNYQINIGDTIGIPGPAGLYPVIVSATIADPHYGSGMVNPTRAWLAAGELSFFVPVAQLSNIQLGIRLKNPDSTSFLWERFARKFNYTGVHLTYSLFKNAYMGIYQIMGNVILVFSIMALLIALFMVRSSIIRAVYDDYKLTGVYEALGFTPKNIVSLYVIQYLLLSIIFIPVGLAVSWFIIKLFLGSISQKLGAFETGNSVQQSIYLISLFVIAVLVVITAFAGSFKAAKINPVEAIRTGAPVRRFSKLLMPKAISKSLWPLPVIMALRFLSANPKRSISQGIIIMLTIFIILFSINISSSFENLKYNKPAWGFENGDIQLSRREAVVIGLNNEQLIEILSKEKTIERVVPFTYTSLSILSKGGLPIQEINGKAYADSLSHAGLLNLQGRHPQSANEIALCIGTARQFIKKPGDSISVFIEGQKSNFLVTGIYQDVSNMGQGFRLHANAMKKLNPIYTPSVYSIKLKENTNVKEYKNYLLKKLGETITIDASIEDRIAQMGIISGMKTALFSLSFFFTFIMLLTIGSDMLITIKENQLHFGILKSIGWTPGQIRISMVWKILFIAVTVMLAAIPAGIWISPVLMGKVTGGIGLVKFPFIINYQGMLMSIPLTLLLISACSWWLSRGAASANPRTLINS